MNSAWELLLFSDHASLKLCKGNKTAKIPPFRILSSKYKIDISAFFATRLQNLSLQYNSPTALFRKAMLLYNLMTALVNPNKKFYKVFPVKISVMLREMMFTKYI